MPIFLCKIGTADGRVVEKEFEAASRDLLRETLEEQGFSIFRIRKRPLQFLRIKDMGRGRLSGRRFLSFNQELLVLIRSGLPILQVLDTLIERMEPGATLDMLREVREDVRGGSALSEALEKFPRQFPHLYIASIRAGERTGEIPVTLGRFIVYQKRAEALRSKVRGATFYPILLGIAVCAVLLFLFLYVIPTFSQIFADAQVPLPFLTRLLIAAADGLAGSLPLLVPLLLAAAFGGRLFFRSERGSLLLDRLKLVVPYIGTLLVNYALAGFCRTFGTVLASGIPVVQAMQMARGTLNNQVLEVRLNRAMRRVEEGAAIAESLEQTGFFPLIALRMIAAGETGGSLGEMLMDVADYYEGEVERMLELLTTLIEPVMMMSMGVLIGGIVIAMYIPIFQLGATIH